MRVCPECGTQTESKVCPNDGLRTIGEHILAPADPLLGRTVAQRYTIEAPIGKGGMGAVYQARHEETGGLVALKVLHRDRAGSAEAIKRFHLEAQNAAVLQHSNTVRILDFGVDAQLMFLVMEYLHGETLGDRLKRVGALPWQMATDIARQVLSALWEAHEHERRIVHRDIKPANIFLVEQRGAGEVAKVLDFGVARSLEGTGAGTQGMIGTPKAMAPEQWRGEQVDARADLYSVGCLLYEMLCGHAPFVADPTTPTSDQIVRMAHAHAHELPPPLQRATQSRIPTGVVRLTHLLLEKDPARRPQSARVTLELLDRACQGDALESGAKPLSELATLDGEGDAVGGPHGLPDHATDDTADAARPPGELPSAWESAVVAPVETALPGSRLPHGVGALDETALPEDAKLPRAWDAPAPRRPKRSGKPTLFMTVDSDAAVGAPEQTVDSLSVGVPAQSYGEAAPGADGAPAGGPAARRGDDPAPHRHAPSDLPWQRGVAAEAPPAERPSADIRRSGGWGDELFGLRSGDPSAGKGRPGSGDHAAPGLDDEAPAGSAAGPPPGSPPSPVADAVHQRPTPRRDRDAKGVLARVLVLVIVGGALYGGGKFAWERVQQPPKSAMEVATAPVDVPPAPIVTGAALTLEEEDDRGEARPLFVYRARLSRRDHRDARGHKLRGTWRVLVRDRERHHTHYSDVASKGNGKASDKASDTPADERGDTSDPRYGSKKARAALQKLLRARRLPEAIRHAVSTGTPLVEVQVWPDQVTVRLLEK